MKRFLFLFLLTSQAAMSQTPDSTQVPAIPPKSNFKFSFTSSISYALVAVSTPNLRSYFRANEIKPSFGLSEFVHLNFGLRYERFRLMSQSGRGASLISSESKNYESRVARQSHADYLGYMLGYDVLNGRNRRLYANIGLGTATYEYSVYRRTTQPVDFQDLTQYNQPGNIPSLKLTNTCVDFNLEYVQREKRKQSAEATVRLGYRRGLNPRAWESDAFGLQEAPTDRINQFYLQVGYNFSLNFNKGANLFSPSRETDKQ
jgi:hypothetical protein